MPTLLDEELALLRGRTGDNAPSTHISPYFNRLPWNLSKSPVGGEVAYMVNYDISGRNDEAVLDEKDAADLYPQGHGDAYGHNVDYYDEAKFAKAAYDVAKVASAVVDRTARKAYRDNGGASSAGYLDDDPTRAFGYGEWASRGGFGALANWAVANALLAPAPETGRYWRYRFGADSYVMLNRENEDEALPAFADGGTWTCELQIVPDESPIAPGEDEAAFRERLADALVERKAAAVAALEQDFAKKEQQAVVRLQKAQAKLDKESNDVRAKGLETVISVGSALLGGFLGGRRGGGVTRTTQGMRSAGQLLKERQDVQLAKEEVARLEQGLETLSADKAAKLHALDDEWAPDAVAVETIAVTPRKSDIFDVRVCLLWREEG